MIKILKTKKVANISKFFLSVFIISILVAPSLMLAADVNGTNPPVDYTGQNPPSASKTIIKNPFKSNTIQGLIEAILNDILLPIGGVVAVLAIMYAGFLYVTAGGDPGKIKEAHSILKYAVIGSAILLGAWTISKAIEATINDLRV